MNVQQSVDLQIAPTTVTQTVTTTRTPHQEYHTNRGTPQSQGYAPNNSQEQGYAPNNAAIQRQEYAPRNNTTFHNPTSQHQEPRNSTTSQNREYAPRNNTASNRSVDQENHQKGQMSQPYRGDSSSTPRSNAYDSPNPQDEDDRDLVRQNPIPRKQIGASANAPYPSVQASSPPMAQTGHSRLQSGPKPLPATPAATNLGYTDRQTESAPQPSSILNRSRPISTSQAGSRDAQDVVDQSKINTYDTQVVETVAPG